MTLNHCLIIVAMENQGWSLSSYSGNNIFFLSLISTKITSRKVLILFNWSFLLQMWNKIFNIKGVAECGKCTNTHLFFFRQVQYPPPLHLPNKVCFLWIYVFSMFSVVKDDWFHRFATIYQTIYCNTVVLVSKFTLQNDTYMSNFFVYKCEICAC